MSKLINEDLQFVIDAFTTFGEAGGARQLGISRGMFRSRLATARARGLVGGCLTPAGLASREIDATQKVMDDAHALAQAQLAVLPIPTTKATVGRTQEEFVRTFDDEFIIPNKIKQALAKLGNGWLYEEEFRKMAEIGTVGFFRFRGQFTDHIVVIKGPHPKRIWVGTKSQAEAFRKRVAQ